MANVFRVLPVVLLAVVLSGFGGAAEAKPSPTTATSATRSERAVTKNRVKERIAPKARKQVVSSARKPQASRSAVKPEKASGVVSSLIPRPSFAHAAGLHATPDSLGLKSNVALVVDQNTREVLLSKNDSAVLPIASLTKLMTGLVIADANLPMDERIEITQDDVDTLKGSGSRLPVGSTLSRGELLHLALMSSENRAAHALGRTFPGGLSAFVEVMNVKAKLLGMSDTHYVDPTGLSPQNQSSAKDLAALAVVAYDRPVLRELSTSTGYEVDTGRRTLHYRNTNRLVSSPDWDIGLQKTGYISEAGRCLVMQAKMAGRQVIMVFLDSAGTLTRIADAQRVRRWVEAQ